MLDHEISYRRGLNALLARQTDTGCWTATTSPEPSAPSVALTASAIVALSHRRCPAAYASARRRAVGWLLDRQHIDGGFGEGRSGDHLRPAATAMALRALCAAGRRQYAEPIARAVRWLVSVQATYGPERGGIGRGEAAAGRIVARPISDPRTTADVADAVRLSRVPVPRRFWIDLIAYLRGLQNHAAINRLNRPAHDRLRARGLRFGDDGGHFDPASIDGPGLVSAAEPTLRGIIALQAAGLNDAAPELHAALGWLRSLDPAPSATDRPTAARCRLLASALAAIDDAGFNAHDGQNRDWIADIAGQLMNQQGPDGTWAGGETAEALLAWTHLFDALDGRAPSDPRAARPLRTAPPVSTPCHRRPATARVVRPHRKPSDRVRPAQGAAGTAPPRARAQVLTGWGVLR